VAADVTFSVRVRHVTPGETRAYARTSSFVAGSQASLRERDEHPSAVELLLGALGADLIQGLAAQAAGAGLAVEAMEASLSARLNNPLAHLGVVGETGHAGIEEVVGVVYGAIDGEDADIRRLWSVVLERSPLFQTLTRAARVAIELRLT
jgi:hypothetical protein